MAEKHESNQKSGGFVECFRFRLDQRKQYAKEIRGQNTRGDKHGHIQFFCPKRVVRAGDKYGPGPKNDWCGKYQEKPVCRYGCWQMQSKEINTHRRVEKDWNRKQK